MGKSLIYLICWKDAKYFYIGQTSDLNRRKREHLSRFTKNKHENNALQNVYNKYGAPKFQILETVEENKINELEQWYLDLFHGHKHCLNISKCAEVPSRGLKHSIETKRKMSKARFGTKLSKSHRENISLALKGRKFSEVTKRKMATAKSLPILQYSKDLVLLKEWTSIREIAKELQACRKTIKRCIDGEKVADKSIVSKFIWKQWDGEIV